MDEKKLSHRRILFIRIVAYPLFLILSIVLPLVLWASNSPIAGYTYSKKLQPFELFCFFASIFIFIAVGFEAWIARIKETKRLIPYGLFVLAALYFLTVTVDFNFKAWDYECYENAAKSHLEGKNPYEGTYYLYPPLTYQIMSGAYHLLGFADSFLETGQNSWSRWDLIFYLYQCMQFVLIMFCFLCCIDLARRLKISAEWTPFLVTALFVFDSPLIRTLRHNQVNLWLLAFMLFAFLQYRKQPFSSGVLLAAASFIKLYPLILILPFLVMRRVRVVIGFTIGAVAILAVQTRWMSDFSSWSQFIGSLKSFPEYIQFRNNSMLSLITNLARVAKFITGYKWPAEIIWGIVFFICVIVLIWIFSRLMQREKTFKSSTDDRTTDLLDLDAFRSMGHFADAIALMLLISPLAWEHHYLFALPIVIYAVATRMKIHPYLIMLGAILIFSIPIFDVFPFSYHRCIGLFLLLVATQPDKAILTKKNNPVL